MAVVVFTMPVARPDVPELKSVPDVAATKPVPFPLTNPVTVVERVIAGVVVGVATVPERPFAVTTEVDDTVPPVTTVDHELSPLKYVVAFAVPVGETVASVPSPKLVLAVVAVAVSSDKLFVLSNEFARIVDALVALPAAEVAELAAFIAAV